MLKGTRVLYIAPSGQVFTALVKALNGLNPGFMTLVYVDPGAPENDNVKTAFDVPHMSDSSKDENNPDLPRYVLNCWKEVHEYHKELPADHPNFDHPNAKFEENAEVREAVAKAGGKPILAERPLYAAHIEEHQAIQAEVKKAEAEAETPGTPDLSLPMGEGPLQPLAGAVFIADAGELVMGVSEIFMGASGKANAEATGMQVERADPSESVVPDSFGNSAPPVPPVEVEQWKLPPVEVEITHYADVIAYPHDPRVDPTPEPDVTAQLDAAGPAPVVEEKKPEDAA